MRYFLDTEFWERGPAHPIQLISIGLVAEDGRELYLENSQVDLEALSPWLKANVVPHLNGQTAAPAAIRAAVVEFIGNDPKPEFWADYAAYDWVVFAQLFGAMIDLPEHFPMFCRDFQQLLDGRLPPRDDRLPGEDIHNALADAQFLKRQFEALTSP